MKKTIIAILLCTIISCTKQNPAPQQSTTPVVDSRINPPQGIQGEWYSPTTESSLSITTNDIVYNNISIAKRYKEYRVIETIYPISYRIETDKPNLLTQHLQDVEEFVINTLTKDSCIYLHGNVLVRDSKFYKK